MLPSQAPGNCIPCSTYAERAPFSYIVPELHSIICWISFGLAEQAYPQKTSCGPLTNGQQRLTPAPGKVEPGLGLQSSAVQK